MTIDRGVCIGCNECVDDCPTDTIINDSATATWTYQRDDLHVTAESERPSASAAPGLFRRSLSVRVISTGCSACNLELAAAGNPIFDLDRFGVNVVASPRFADALLVTGPVPQAMQAAVLSCYEAMSEPKLVIACGTCAISGGVHAGGYAEANGAASILPIDIFIPGCPPHPWQLIRGILAARELNGHRRALPPSSTQTAVPARFGTKPNVQLPQQRQYQV